MLELIAHSEEMERRAIRRSQGDEAFRQAELYRAALDAMPEAVVVCDEEGTICYANPRLEALFGYDAGTLVDRPVTTLVPERLRGPKRRSINEFLADPHPVRIGGDEALYARRQNGSEFRVMILLDSVATSSGPITTCIVRDFVTEVDSRRRFFTAGEDRSYVN